MPLTCDHGQDVSTGRVCFARFEYAIRTLQCGDQRTGRRAQYQSYHKRADSVAGLTLRLMLMMLLVLMLTPRDK